MRTNLIFVLPAVFTAAVICAGCVTFRTSGTPAVTPTVLPVKTPVANNQTCGFTTCHGADVRCGPDIAEICTMVYMPNDRCR